MTRSRSSDNPNPPGAETPAGRAAAWAFLLLVATLPWTIAPMGIATGLCALLTLPLWMRQPQAFPRTPVGWPTVAWVVALLLSATFALDPRASFARVPKGLFPLLVPLAAHHAARAGVARRALGVLLGSASLAALTGLGLWLAKGAAFPARARGPVGHYMTFAGQLLLFVSLAAALAALARERRWRWGALAAALAGAAALAATFTRSAWIGMAVSLAVVLGLARPRLLLPLAGGIVLLLLAAPPAYRARALSAFDPHHPMNVERTCMWQGGLAMWRDHPLTGVGLQDMKPVYDLYKPPQARERAGHLHSVPIQIAASMGAVGLLAWILLYGSLFAASARGLRPLLARGGLPAAVRVGVTAALAGFLVAGLFEWNLGDEELLYPLYTLVGIAWAARAWEAEPASAGAPASAPARAAPGLRP